MRKIYVSHEVGDTCAVCPHRQKDHCKLFDEILFSRALIAPQDRGHEHERSLEFQRAKRCADAPTNLGSHPRQA